VLLASKIVTWHGGDEQSAAPDALQHAVRKSTILMLVGGNASFVVTDASDYALGASLRKLKMIPKA
jgi:hypothetical protein